MSQSFQEAVAEICREDGRYHRDAYHFLIEALDVTVKVLRKSEPDRAQHVTGGELLEGLREYALVEFGPLAYTVLTEWGVHTTEAVGDIVYNLIKAGRLGKTESDKPEDFFGLYDFKETFMLPYEPEGSLTNAPATSGTQRRKND